jgi:hypothetical protein
LSESADPLSGLPDDRSWSREAYRQAVIRKGADRACSACGSKRWAVSDALLLIEALDPIGRLTPGRGVEVVPVYCRDCGLLRLHAASQLLAD